jgi:hypothetical protein
MRMGATPIRFGRALRAFWRPTAPCVEGYESLNFCKIRRKADL